MPITFGKHKAVLKKKILLHEALGIFEFETDSAFTFEPGQFVTFDWKNGEKTIKRSYSLATAPHEVPKLGFYVRKVRHGTFTPSLFELEEGAELNMAGPLGHFVLDNTPRTAVLIASGTGLGPYISMARHLAQLDADRQLIIVHGTSYVKDLGFKEELEAMDKASQGKTSGFRLRYIPTISRPKEEPVWAGETGRAESLLEKGRIEALTGTTLDPLHVVVYACGHPDMVENVIIFFERKGFQKMKDIKFEKYW